jgi:hypothetical protein
MLLIVLILDLAEPWLQLQTHLCTEQQVLARPASWLGCTAAALTSASSSFSCLVCPAWCTCVRPCVRDAAHHPQGMDLTTLQAALLVFSTQVRSPADDGSSSGTRPPRTVPAAGCLVLLPAWPQSSTAHVML